MAELTNLDVSLWRMVDVVGAEEPRAMRADKMIPKLFILTSSSRTPALSIPQTVTQKIPPLGYGRFVHAGLDSDCLN